MEVLPTEEIEMAANGAFPGVTITYELSANAYVADGEIKVTAPTPMVVKDIIVGNFDVYGSVIMSRMYVTECHFTFMTDVNPKNFELIMWNVECELYFRYGVTFQYYVISYSEGEYSGGWDLDTDHNVDIIGGAGSASGSDSENNSVDPMPDPKPLIDPTGIDNDAISGIYKKFYTRSSIFRKVLKDFCAENSIAHLYWTTNQTLADTVLGRFEWEMKDYTFTISLNEAKLINYPELVTCKTMIHESIHAKMFMDLLKVRENPVGNRLDRDALMELGRALNNQNFPTMFEYHQKYTELNVIQHEYMGDYYIRTMASALQEISDVDSETATAIAWTGLKKTTAWGRLSEAERKYYDTLYFEYRKNNPNIIMP